MIVNHVADGKFADYSVKDRVITFSLGKNNTMDITVPETNVGMEKIFDIYADNKMQLTMDKSLQHVATIIVPPSEISLVATGKKDENGEPMFDSIASKITFSQVAVNLWPLSV